MGFDNLEKIAHRSVNLETLLPEFAATIRAMIITTDQKTDSEVLMMKVEMEDGKELTQKLKGMHIAELLDVNFANMKLKTMSDVLDEKFKFKKTTFRIGFPRWLPVEVIEQ